MFKNIPQVMELESFGNTCIESKKLLVFKRKCLLKAFKCN